MKLAWFVIHIGRREDGNAYNVNIVCLHPVNKMKSVV